MRQYFGQSAVKHLTDMTEPPKPLARDLRVSKKGKYA